MEKNSIIGLDIAKMSFEVCVQNTKGHTLERKRLRRDQVLSWFALREPSRVGMEACGGAHYWARELIKRGHEVRILPPQYVKPYVVRNKSDRHDARAIAQALRDPEVPSVEIASPENQGIQILHRVRTRLIRQRTAMINQLRGFLLEFGIALPKRIYAARQGVKKLLEEKPESLSMACGMVVEDYVKEFQDLDDKIDEYTKKIERSVQADPAARRVQKVLGVGALSASALVLKIRHESTYKNGRHFAASIGLVPRHDGTGGLLRIKQMSKRGDRYLRTLLIHGARAVVSHVNEKQDSLSRWIKAIVQRRGTNKAVVAMANKNARIAWHVIVREEEYNPDFAMSRYRQVA